MPKNTFYRTLKVGQMTLVAVLLSSRASHQTMTPPVCVFLSRHSGSFRIAKNSYCNPRQLFVNGREFAAHCAFGYSSYLLMTTLRIRKQSGYSSPSTEYSTVPVVRRRSKSHSFPVKLGNFCGRNSETMCVAVS
jgi:hypothetical protein